jgi:hypothetical protein
VTVNLSSERIDEVKSLFEHVPQGAFAELTTHSTDALNVHVGPVSMARSGSSARWRQAQSITDGKALLMVVLIA